MNWNDLVKWIEKLSPEQRQTNVTVHVHHMDEFYAIFGATTAIDGDVLDKDHPYLRSWGTMEITP